MLILILKDRRKTKLGNRIPGPRGSIFIGNVSMAFRGPKLLFKTFFKEYRKHEKSLFKFWIFNRLIIVLTRPEDIETVFNSSKFLIKSKEYSIGQNSIMGQGLLTINDSQKWRNNRKMVVKGLNFTLLKSVVSVFFEEATTLAEILLEKHDLVTNDCELYNPISMATMDMIGKTSLGVSFDTQRGGRNTFLDNLELIMQTWQYRFTRPWYLNNILYRFSPIKRKHDRSQKIIYKYIDEIISSKSIELSQNERTCEINTDTHDEDFHKKKQTIIEILLRHSHEMPHEQIRDEIITILIGGQDTTALIITCAIFMLAHHENVQDKVYEELQSIFSMGDRREPTYEDLQQMKYLEQVIKETMRLFPAIPWFGRSLDDDAKIGDYLCPAGSTLLVLPLLLQTSPLYYPNPKKFNPDNFLPEAINSRHPYTWIPFSAGLRNCIGIKYAMLQLKTVLSTLVRKLKFSPSNRCPTPENVRFKFTMTLKFMDGCHIKIEPRT